MKFGLQMSSLKKFLQTPQDVLETFKKVKTIGYNYVQIEWINEDVSMESIKESLNEAGLVCVGTQDSFNDVFNNTDKIIKRNLLWQAKYICGAVNIPSENSEMLELADKINSVSKKVNENGLILEIHPMFTSFIMVGNTAVSLLDMMWEHLDYNILLQPDFYHVVRGKSDPVRLIERYNGRIANAHFKDFKILNENLDMSQLHNFDPLKQGDFPVTPVGQGIVPYKEIIEACIEHGVKYAWAEQEAWDKDPFECMKESFEYLAGMRLETK